MASSHVETLVETRVAANWTHCPVYARNDIGDVPSDGSAFIFIEFPVSRSERLPLASRVYREEGGVRFLINVPRGSGMQQIRDWAEELGGLFGDIKIDGVRFGVPAGPYSDDQSDQGSYWQSSLVVDFWRIYKD